MNEIEFIIYVADQKKSKIFYENLLQIEPVLDVQGMTEFVLADSVKPGIIPENGMAKILSDEMPHPNEGSGIPGCELYLKVDNATKYMKRGVMPGGKEISVLPNRDWGDEVGYIADFDGHIIGFAEKKTTNNSE